MRVLDSAKREKEVQLNQLNKQKVRLNPFIQPLLVCNQKLVYSNGCFFCLQSVGAIVTVFHCCDYRPQTKLWKGNVFTSVCQEFCPQGEGVADTPLWPTPPWADTSPGRHPSRADTPPGQTHPLARHPPGRHPLLGPTPSPWADPPARRPLQRTVRILMECILIFNSHFWIFFYSNRNNWRRNGTRRFCWNRGSKANERREYLWFWLKRTGTCINMWLL